MGKIDAWVPKIPRLKSAKVSRFSYRDAAYTNDDIEGVENYDYTRDMNVPSLTKTDTEASVLDAGARAQFSSLTKNALNHFFGRVSYNLNKVIDFLSDFLDDFIELRTRYNTFSEFTFFSTSGYLGNHADGVTRRLISTSSSVLSISLPSGETYKGSGSISLAPYRMLVILKVGNTWVEQSSSNIIDDTKITNANTFSAEYINYRTLTVRYNANFTGTNYPDYTRIRIQNTHTSNTITCTMPSGKTMNGQATFTIAPDTMLEFEVSGNKWLCISKVQELIWLNPNPTAAFVPAPATPETTSGQIEQFKSLIFTFSSLAPDVKYQHSMEVILTPTISKTNLFVGQPGAYKSRQITNFSGNSVQFSTGYSDSTQDHNCCIPIAIYGVK